MASLILIHACTEYLQVKEICVEHRDVLIFVATFLCDTVRKRYNTCLRLKLNGCDFTLTLTWSHFVNWWDSLSIDNYQYCLHHMTCVIVLPMILNKFLSNWKLENTWYRLQTLYMNPQYAQLSAGQAKVRGSTPGFVTNFLGYPLTSSFVRPQFKYLISSVHC